MGRTKRKMVEKWNLMSWRKWEARRRRRKSVRRKAKQASSSAQAKVKKTLTPEEVFYEGPPAITETLAPTASILTVVGIIPPLRHGPDRPGSATRSPTVASVSIRASVAKRW